MESRVLPGFVGPVLTSGEIADAIVAAIRAENRRVHVADQGSYLRVAVPLRCVVTRAAVERELGRAFRMPGDLELVMPSFAGRLSIGEHEAQWTLAANPATAEADA